ncbi:hypothetical protein [Parasitella parasitica]|uniref:RNA-binding protein vts1-like alpha-helical domain-containing protein n=1 Tax=Parasitella parasitica TaxID=35722 RepID=A0A0B7NWJ1_9FUNG|nr:hypothetical protein [Parasitella parasitica]
MTTAHDVHRVMEENLFGAFQRPNTSYRSLTASDLISVPSQRRHISSVTGPVNSYQQPPVPQYKCRPASDILQTQPTMKKNNSSPEAEAIDRWFENIQRYERMLEEVAAASLDQGFKDELQHINQWFRCRSDAERTAALYTVVQNASQIQIRFLITVLEKIANGGETYPAGQENTTATATATASNNTVQHQIHLPFNSSHEPASEFDTTRLPPSSRRRPFVPSSAISEPDDLGRRNRDLFVSRPLGLSHPGPLYEKALAARAQLQALNGTASSSSSSTTTTTTSTCSTVSSSSGIASNANGGTGGLFSSPPRLRTSCSTTDLGSKSLFSSTDWPFPLNTAKSTTKNDDSWSFGSLGSKKKLTSAPGSTVGAKKKDDMLPWAIQEEDQEYSSKLTATITSSLSALEQAQARLRQELSLPSHKKTIMPITQWTPSPSPPAPAPAPAPALAAAVTASTATTTTIASTPTIIAPPPPSTPNQYTLQETPQCGHYLAPSTFEAPGEDNNTDDDQSDDAATKEEKPLTGLARRRKRSSAARALKDKLAAEAVDFELMKDVQNWLRSLRLHKYGHAFVGLDWQQVIRMSDQDMIDAGPDIAKKTIPLLLVAAASSVFACEMDCRRGLSRDFAGFYVPVIKDTISDLHSQLTKAIKKVSVPSTITNQLEKSELLDDIQESIESSLNAFVALATSQSRLAEGFYQVMFNEELPYKGDCNNPRRLTRKMPPPGESWTMDECRKMDYRCGNPPSICYFLEDVKQRCIGRMRRQMTEHASFDNGALVKSLVRDTRKSIYDTLSNNGVGRLSEDSQVESYIAKLVSAAIRTLDIWVADDVRQLCEKPSQKELCNSWDDAIRKEILKWP